MDALAADLGRPLSLIAESDLNDPRIVTPRAGGGLGLHAQWSDDFHHALHTALTGESQGYYEDFARAPFAALAKTLSGGYFHDGTYSTFRGRAHGRPLDRTGVAAHRLLGYTQTHDQIGNRAQGDRLSASLSPGLLACAAALMLTGPFTPMLFMGEEWAAGTPWQFFTDHTDPELAEAVRRGRRREFTSHGWAEEDVPDPQDPATRDRSCLDWSEPERGPHARVLSWYRDLIALRHTQPDLTDPDLSDIKVAYDEEARWIAFRRGDVRVVANLAPKSGGDPPGPTAGAGAGRLGTGRTAGRGRVAARPRGVLRGAGAGVSAGWELPLLVLVPQFRHPLQQDRLPRAPQLDSEQRQRAGVAAGEALGEPDDRVAAGEPQAAQTGAGRVPGEGGGPYGRGCADREGESGDVLGRVADDRVGPVEDAAHPPVGAHHQVLAPEAVVDEDRRTGLRGELCGGGRGQLVEPRGVELVGRGEAFAAPSAARRSASRERGPTRGTPSVSAWRTGTSRSPVSSAARSASPTAETSCSSAEPPGILVSSV